MSFKLLELFSGYGSQALALRNLGVDFVSEISEIDKYAIKAYNQIHGETHNWGDITKIDETQLPHYDLITYSSPCQDFSVAGLGKGGDKDSGTRSSLLWECERIIRAVKPKYLLMENVKNLLSDKHKHNFFEWFKVLESLGYQNFYKVLNAKDYGIPQNRERIFCVSIRGGGQFLFPTPVKLERRLKDMLDQNVDEKYYLSDSQVQKFSSSSFRKEKERIQSKDYCDAVLSRDWKGPKLISEPLCAASRGRNPDNPSDRTVGTPTEQRLEINETGCSNTLTSVQKDNYVLTPKVIQLGNIVETDSFGGNPQCGRVYSDDGISPTLNTMQGGGREPKITECHRIRKLTPRECWRLMGVKDEQFDKLHDISNSQLYKLAGNSIVVDVLMAIFKNLFISDKETKGQLTLF